MNKHIRFIALTGLMLALTAVLQSFGKLMPLGPYNNFVTGSLVNACLLTAVSLTGPAGGAAVSVLSPLLSLLTGSVTPLPFVPFIAIGNLSLVILFYLLRSRRAVISLALPAIVKFALLYASIHMLLPYLALPEAQGKTMLFLFGWPQLVTALAGGALALMVRKKLGITQV